MGGMGPAMMPQPLPAAGLSGMNGMCWPQQLGCFSLAHAAAVATASTTSIVLLPGQPSNAVISSKICAYGTGDGCDDLADGNEYIRQLQAKRTANKEANILVRI